MSNRRFSLRVQGHYPGSTMSLPDNPHVFLRGTPTPTQSSLADALATRVVIADGAMGTMLQAHDLGLADFEGHEGCNEILNVTRPDIVESVHDAYFAVGVDCVETNTFGANLANLGEYGISDRIAELAEAGARIARRSADRWSTPDTPRWVLGSMGPGTKLPTLGHVSYATLRDAYAEQAAGLIDGGVDALLIETAQDLLQAKAAINGARIALSGADVAFCSSPRSPSRPRERCCWEQRPQRRLRLWSPWESTSSVSTARPGPRR